MEPAVKLTELTKVFRVPIREPGLRAALVSLIHRRNRDVRAVDRITLALAAGFAIVLLGITRGFWRFALRHYSGASA